MKKYAPSDLENFRDLPIVPIIRSNVICALGFLKFESKIIFKHHGCQDLPDNIAESLQESFGATVLRELPKYFDHPQLINFIFRPNSDSVIRLLLQWDSSRLVQLFGNFQNGLKNDWCKFLATVVLPSNASNERNMLRNLPIFEARKQSGRNKAFFSNLIWDGIMVEPLEMQSDPLPDNLPLFKQLVSRSAGSATLASVLEVPTLSWESLIVSLLNPTAFSRFSLKQKLALALWILEEKRFINFSYKVHEALKGLELVPCTDDQNLLASPQNLFNPSVPKLKDLFLGESKFPTGVFADEKILGILKRLGLKEKPSFSDVTNSARLVHPAGHFGTTLSSADSKIKSHAVVHWLGEFAVFESKEILEIPFLPVLKTPPSGYPNKLGWGGSLNGAALFESPEKCRPRADIELVGSTMAISSAHILVPNVRNFFGWKGTDGIIGHIVQHLKNLSQVNVEDQRMMKKILEKIYESFDKSQNLNWIIRQLTGFKWIWNGSGFSSPKEMTLDSDNLNLQPYMYNIPEDFMVFKNLFLQGGVSPTLKKDIVIRVLNCIKDCHDDVSQTLNQSRQNKDLHISIRMLEWMSLQNLEDSRILIPVQTVGKNLLLKPVGECMYSDMCSVEDLEDMSEHLEGRAFIIHHDISRNLATSLRVPSMTNRLINADEFGFEGFEEFGPHEPLTQRIKNILEEYPDDTGIFKEQLQNADDAGATEVGFVIDFRKNQTNGLLDPGMAECQGSALWSYNNATFSESDFENLQKLGGQTKKDQVEKIGRFGIGFNSVYHVTDMPSFISGDHVVFMDPYTTHLNERITNKTRPGLKINFVQTKFLKSYGNQFEPYNGLFGCRITSTPGAPPTSFNGTLFRLPFRSRLQKDISDREHMSNKIYTETQINELVKALTSSAETLLLFTQNVKKVSLFVIPENGSPTTMKEKLSIKKDPLQVLPSLSDGPTASIDTFFQQQSNVLKLVSSVMNDANQNVKQVSISSTFYARVFRTKVHSKPKRN